jgi:hypothetical protein
MGELMSQVRSVIPIFLIAALVLVFGVMFARRAGLFADTVTVTGTSAAFAAADGTPNASASPASDGTPEADATPEAPASRRLEIVTLLPKDAIPAIFDPTFVEPAVADTWLRPDDQVIGVTINGESRAYGTAFLSSREIVNDTVGGRPIMVTW